MSDPTNIGPEHPANDSATQGFYVQVIAVAPGVHPQSVQGTLKKIGRKELEAVGNVVDVIQDWLLAKIDAIAQKPSKVSIEFGIDAEGEAGVPFVTKGSIGANFKVAMEWERRD